MRRKEERERKEECKAGMGKARKEGIESTNQNTGNEKEEREEGEKEVWWSGGEDSQEVG